MCRILAVTSSASFEARAHLQAFARIARTSKEYQGHGWGCALWRDNRWEIYRNIKPVWEDDLEGFGTTTRLLVHARSAFKNEGIVVENNMPFCDGRHVFIFNGELRGVKIKSAGGIGAEKIFNFVRRFNKDKSEDLSAAFCKAMPLVEKRSEFVRAMNIVIADDERVYLNSLFNDDPGYFTMYRKKAQNMFGVESMHIISSQPYPGEEEAGWEKIENRTIEVFQ